MSEVAKSHLLTVEEIARKLHVSRSTVYNLIWRGSLPYINLACGRRRLPRIRACDLESFIKSRQQGVPAAEATGPVEYIEQ